MAQVATLLARPKSLPLRCVEVWVETEQMSDGWWVARIYTDEGGDLMVLTPLVETPDEAKRVAKLMWSKGSLCLPPELHGVMFSA